MKTLRKRQERQKIAILDFYTRHATSFQLSISHFTDITFLLFADKQENNRFSSTGKQENNRFSMYRKTVI